MIFDPLFGPHKPAPADEQTRLLRLLAAHRHPDPVFGDALPPGSFNGALAARMQQQPEEAASAESTGKRALYRRTLAIVQRVRGRAPEWK